MSAQYMALMANLLGSASAARATLERDIGTAKLAQAKPTAQTIETLLLLAPTTRALSNVAQLMDLLDAPTEEVSTGLLAIYQRRMQVLQTAPLTTENPNVN